MPMSTQPPMISAHLPSFEPRVLPPHTPAITLSAVTAKTLANSIRKLKSGHGLGDSDRKCVYACGHTADNHIQQPVEV